MIPTGAASVLLAEDLREKGSTFLREIAEGRSHSAFPITLKEISMKLRKTFMLAATVALLALLGNVQANAQGARQRPFSDWLNAQETSCDQFVIWWAPHDLSTLAFADYTGKYGA